MSTQRTTLHTVQASPVPSSSACRRTNIFSSDFSVPSYTRLPPAHPLPHTRCLSVYLNLAQEGWEA